MTNSKHFTRRDFLKLSSASIAAGMLELHAPRVFADKGQDIDFQVFHHGRRDQAKIVLSYDDCHLVKKLQALEKTLREYPEAKITLFPTGEALLKTNDKDAGIWQRFVENGHEIGSHTFDHGNPGTRSAKDLINDYAKWLAALYQVTESHPTVRFARPPFGSLSPSYQKMCTEYGLIAAMWSTNWGRDLTVVQKKIETLENGDVALLHTRYKEVEENTPFALSLLGTRGIRAVTISKLYFSSRGKKLNTKGCTPLSYYSQSCPE